MWQSAGMCHAADAHPPDLSAELRPPRPMAGGAIEASDLVLTAADGNRFAAFAARSPAAAAGGAGKAAGVVILPDIRGLFRFYEELAMRFAEAGVDAIALTSSTSTPARPTPSSTGRWASGRPNRTTRGGVSSPALPP
jgi:carboxymethylenebutenolidase